MSRPGTRRRHLEQQGGRLLRARAASAASAASCARSGGCGGRPTSSSTIGAASGIPHRRCHRARGGRFVGDALGSVDDEGAGEGAMVLPDVDAVAADEDARPTAQLDRAIVRRHHPHDAEQVDDRRREAPQPLARQIVAELRVRIGRAVVGDPQQVEVAPDRQRVIAAGRFEAPAQPHVVEGVAEVHVVGGAAGAAVRSAASRRRRDARRRRPASSTDSRRGR